MIHKYSSIFFLNLCVVELNYQIKDKMAVEKGVGGPSGPVLAPPPSGGRGGRVGGEVPGESRERRATPHLADPARSHTPASRAWEALLWGMSVSWHPASCSLYLRGGSAFSKPVGSMHHKHQRTAGLRYRLSPCDKCTSSVVQRFSDTLPWAIILLLLLPSPSHTLSIGSQVPFST